MNPSLNFQSKFLKKLKEDNDKSPNNDNKKLNLLEDKLSQIKVSQNNSINDSNLQLLSNNLSYKKVNIFDQQELEMKDLTAPLNKIPTKKSKKSEKSLQSISKNSFSKNSSMSSSLKSKNDSHKSYLEDVKFNINNNNLKKENKNLDDSNNKSDEDTDNRADFRKIMKREKIVKLIKINKISVIQIQKMKVVTMRKK